MLKSFICNWIKGHQPYKVGSKYPCPLGYKDCTKYYVYCRRCGKQLDDLCNPVGKNFCMRGQ